MKHNTPRTFTIDIWRQVGREQCRISSHPTFGSGDIKNYNRRPSIIRQYISPVRIVDWNREQQLWPAMLIRGLIPRWSCLSPSFIHVKFARVSCPLRVKLSDAFILIIYVNNLKFSSIFSLAIRRINLDNVFRKAGHRLGLIPKLPPYFN